MATTEILYIEDNFHNRRIVRKILERQGYTLHECEDGLEGYEMLKAMKPGIVLLDISLPSMDGMEIAKRVKADPALEHIYLIALTASAMQGDRERFLDGGCDDYLSKPFRALDLVNLVGKYMALVGGDITTPPPLPAEMHDEQKAEAVGAAHPAVVEAAPELSAAAIEAPAAAVSVLEAALEVEQEPAVVQAETFLEAEAAPDSVREDQNKDEDISSDDTGELVFPPPELESVWEVEHGADPVEPEISGQHVDLISKTEAEPEVVQEVKAEAEEAPLDDTSELILPPPELESVWEVEQNAVPVEQSIVGETETVESPAVEEPVIDKVFIEHTEDTEDNFSLEKGKKAIADLIKAGIVEMINSDNLKPVEPNA